MWQTSKKGHLLPDGRIVQVLVAKGFVLCLCFSYSQHAIQWCTSLPTGKLGLTSWGSYMMHREREVQCIVWWLFAPSSSWEAYYSKQLGFDLPILSFLVIESLLLGENPSLPLSPHNLSGLILPPHYRVNVWPGLAQSVCALFRSGMVMWLTLGRWIQLWEICWNYWGKQALGLGHCEDIDL